MRTGKVLHKIESALFVCLLVFLPTQLGKHFWPGFSLLAGLRIDYLSPTLYLTDILIAGLFIVSLCNRNIQVNKKASKIFLGVTCWLLLTIIVNGDIFNGLYHLLKFLEFSFVSYYIVTTRKDSWQVEQMALVLSFGVIGESLLALVQYLNQSSVGGLFYFLGERTFTAETPGIANASLGGSLVLRSYGTFSHPNVLAGFLLITMVFCLFAFFNSSYHLRKLLFLTTLLFGTAGLLLTLSRVAILVWVSILFIFGIVKWRRHSIKKKLFLVALGILAFLIVTSLSSLGIVNRFSQIQLTDEAVVQRQMLLNKSLSLIASHPVLGVGFGAFLPVLAKDKQFTEQAFLQPVHNIFLLLAVETGIVGLAAALFFVTLTYRRLLRMLALDKRGWWVIQSALVSLTAILILGQFDHYFLTLQQGQLLLAVVVGVCWTTAKAHNT